MSLRNPRFFLAVSGKIFSMGLGIMKKVRTKWKELWKLPMPKVLSSILRSFQRSLTLSWEKEESSFQEVKNNVLQLQDASLSNQKS